MRHLRYASVAAAFAFAGILLCNPVQAGGRAFVASTGNDANTASSCAPTSPCRSFTAAMSVVSDGGEIVALDAAGYGAVTVTKSVSIIANPGVYAGIAASSGTAVTIATANVTVILRGLNINNTGTAGTGVSMTNGTKLVIENCVISNFQTAAVNVAVGAEVRVADSVIRDSSDGVVLSNGATATVTGSRFAGNLADAGGIVLTGGPTGTTTTVAVSDSVFSGNWIGVYSCALTGSINRISVSRSTLSNNVDGVASDNCGGTASVIVSNSLITGNSGYGLYNGGGTTFESLGNNTGAQNANNTGGTITTISGF